MSFADACVLYTWCSEFDLGSTCQVVPSCFSWLVMATHGSLDSVTFCHLPHRLTFSKTDDKTQTHNLSEKGERTSHSNKQLSQKKKESLAFHLVVVGVFCTLDKYYLLLSFIGKYGTLFVCGKVDYLFFKLH